MSDAEIEMIRRRLRSAEKDIETIRGETGVCATHILRDKELIERCAQVAHDWLKHHGYEIEGIECAAAIRALKDQP